MIKNILFDLDDTLFDFHKAEKIAIEKTLKIAGVVPSKDLLSKYSCINLSQWKLLELGKLTRNEVKLRRFRLFFEENGIDFPAEKAAATYEQLLGIGHYFIDGAENIIQKLYGRYRLYIVSNGTLSVQTSRIKSSGIAKYFDNIFISEEIGYNKPDREFFDACFGQIKDFKHDETIIVGDSLSSDIKGGINCGITTVWFNPNHALNNTDIKPGHEIDKLDNLLSLLEKL